MNCTIQNCTDTGYAKELCHKHYLKLWRKTNPDYTENHRIYAQKRFRDIIAGKRKVKHRSEKCKTCGEPRTKKVYASQTLCDTHFAEYIKNNYEKYKKV